MSFQTTDTAFAVWLSWKHGLVPIPQPKNGGKVAFAFKNLEDEKAAEFQHEFEQSECFQFLCLYRALTQRTRAS